MRFWYGTAAGAALLASIIFGQMWRPGLAWAVYLAGTAAFAVVSLKPLLLKGFWLPAGVGTVSALATAAGFLSTKTEIAGMFIVRREHGFPLPWISKFAIYEELTPYAPPPTFDTDARWGTLNVIPLALDMLYFACAAMVLVVIIRLVSAIAAKPSAPPATADVSSPASGG